MVASTKAVLGGVVGVVLASVVACGSSTKDSDDDSGTPSSGGTTSSGGAGTGGSSTSGGTGGGTPITNTCPVFTPCGGDVVGTWKVQSACGILSFSSNPACAGELVGETLGGDGAYVFGADGSLDFTGSMTVTAQLAIDADCATASSGKSVSDYCSLLNVAYSTPTDSSQPAFSYDCAVASNVCHCTVVEGPLTEKTALTYTISGNQIVSSSGGTDYCVTGDTLAMRVDQDTSGENAWLTLTRQ